MLRDLLPGLIGGIVPWSFVEDGPVDDGDKERVGCDGGVVERVKGLERARETVEERAAGEGVGEGVGGGEEEVESQSPVGEDSEVGELGADGAAAGGGLAGLADNYEAGDEDVEALRAIAGWC